ncbi:MAG: hypothetical protein A2V70_01540 [Planctomycetes bacterium RBG_13_63_9]|nr:MAG: hypothetical protein A2V70_01540 [Planctomycetes bacterium RBG_13_63_9]
MGFDHHYCRGPLMRFAAIFAVLPTAVLVTAAPAPALEPIPDGLVVFSFDDSAESRENFRRPKDEADLRFWLENMVRYHRFTLPEVSAATGLPADEIQAALKRFGVERDAPAPRGADSPLRVLPYPGGRHPRIGFLDGMIRPQRETKLSVFTPWDPSSYVVLDLPEAIWHDTPHGRQLLYLAHTHIPTIWDQQGIELEKLEWQRGPDGTYSFERRLPNAVAFGTRILPGKDAVRMEMWLRNGTDTTLGGLDVQNCIMLKGAAEFARQSNDNKVSQKPYMACRSAKGDRWVITAWVPCGRCWGNADCPCLHSDPRFPDCPPGETRRLRGWLSFYEGTDLEAELRRIEATGWRERAESGR